MGHLDQYNLLSDKQHAFRKWHSCETQLITVINDWAKILDKKGQVDTFILDFGIDSQIRLFADDCVCYCEIRTVEDTLKLQKDIDLLGSWARKWGMRFQPVKCNMMQLTNKRINKTVLENVDSIKYVGVTITNDLKWNTHINNICTKANRTLGFLRRNLFSCPQDVKEAAYKGL